jgi:hypothetical protein
LARQELAHGRGGGLVENGAENHDRVGVVEVLFDVRPFHDIVDALCVD